ncbi:O-antigen ligase family protein [Thermus sp.]|uniref:O-antigen ligase family protein n=1 Tax=Thermus sp. TaxID=275 RepID=UPI003D0D0843
MNGAIIVALVVFFNIFAPDYALLWSGRAYVLGILFTTAVLVLTNPSVLSFQEAGSRFGDQELLHPNSLGIAYGVALMYLLFIRIYRARFLQVGPSIVVAVALLATFSKTAIAGTLLAVVLAFWSLRGAQRWLLTFLVFFTALAVTLLIGNYLTSQLQTYLDAGHAETLSGRTLLWSWVLDQVVERPILGYGYLVIKDMTALDPRFSSWTTSIVHAHNAYFDVLFSSGYVGLGCFFLFWLYCLKLLFSGVIRLGNSTVKAYLLATFFLLTVRSFTEAGLNLRFDFWIALACGLALEKSLCTRRR